MFLEGDGGHSGALHGAGALHVAESASASRGSEAAALSQELAALEPLLHKVEGHIKRLEAGQLPLLERVYAVMKRYIKLASNDAAGELKALLERMEQRISRH